MSDREIQIIEAYLELAQKIGVESVTLAKIAKHADLAFSTVQGYFGGKDQKLEKAAVSYVGQSAQRYISQYLDKTSIKADYFGIEAYINGTFRWATDLPHHSSFWAYYYYLTTIDSEFRTKNKIFLETARKRVERLINEGIGAGHIPKVVCSASLSTTIHSLLTGGVLVALGDPSKNSLKAGNKSVLRSVHQLLKTAP